MALGGWGGGGGGVKLAQAQKELQSQHAGLKTNNEQRINALIITISLHVDPPTRLVPTSQG